jgi:hypothetical protein
LKKIIEKAIMWDKSESERRTSMSTTSNTHEMYLQNDGLKYDIPILFQGGMDTEECEMYYNLVDAQQTGGVYRHSRKSSRRIVPRETSLSTTTTATPTSILKKSRYTKPIEACRRPGLVRRFSFSDKGKKEIEVASINTLRRSTSMCNFDTPRVGFHEVVHVVTIYPIDEIPYDVRHNLWMSYDELMISMHEAAIEKIEEEIAKRKQEDKSIISVVERRNSDTSVIMEDGKRARETEMKNPYPCLVSRVA